MYTVLPAAGILLGMAVFSGTARGNPVEVPPDGAVLPAAIFLNPQDPNDTAPGDLYVEPSTLHSLGFEWQIAGDENRNSRVAVAYRKSPNGPWRQGLDLLSIHDEIVDHAPCNQTYRCGRLHAGSILFLEPNTRYEVRLTMEDPDHVVASGEGLPAVVAERRLLISTKSEPQKHPDGRRLHVYPESFSGPRNPPSFDDLMGAYDAAAPGDRILLHAGTYGGNYTLSKKGTRRKPLVIAAAGDGPVVFAGSGTLFDVSAADYHWFEGLTMRGHGSGSIVSFEHGTTRGLTVRRCRFEDHGTGVWLRSRACRDVYVADNTFVGTEGTWHRGGGLIEKKEPYKAVWVAGQGIDVAHNRVENHWDGLSVFQPAGLPSPRFEENMVAIDFYNNDVRQIVDDNEADGAAHNVRFFHNLFVDMHVGLSAQPVYGGPIYFVRNVQYNVTRGVPFKLNCNPAGVLIYNNTTFATGSVSAKGVATLGGTPASNTHVHNNIFLGLGGATLTAGFHDPEVSSLDYNGYAVVGPIVWRAYDARKGRYLARQYESFEAFSKGTGFEAHVVPLEIGDLAAATIPQGQATPKSPEDIGDLRLHASSRAVDRGIAIPNITDHAAGRAPDLGAYELGQPMPHYGPRPAAAK